MNLAWTRRADRRRFPSARPTALEEPNGLLAAGGDLSPERLLDAYRHGIFPWYEEGQPVLWWSPDPRMVLLVAEFRLRRSLAKVVRNGGFEMRVDTAFPRGDPRCAEVRGRGRTAPGSRPTIIAAYCELHRRGYAHSVEAWRDGRLVGGLYGVALGRMFFGESMFALRARRVEGRARAPGRAAARAGLSADRLPAGDLAPRVASARGRFPAGNLPSDSPN